MWMYSDEETGPICCDSCRNMIDEEQYGEHWPACKASALKPKPSAPASLQQEKVGQREKPEREKTEKVERKEVVEQKEEVGRVQGVEGGEVQSIDCPTCGSTIALDKIDQHIGNCRQVPIELQVECSYCQASFPAFQIESHENECENNNSEMNSPQFRQFLEMMGNNGNSNGRNNANAALAALLSETSGNANANAALAALLSGGQGNANGNTNAALVALLQARQGLQGGRAEVVDPTEQLLRESLYPALVELDKKKGLKRSKLKLLPTEPYSKESHSETQCSICQDEFQEGTEVMKIACQHIQHARCYKEWLQRSNTCPLCKTVIKPIQEDKRSVKASE